MGPSHHRIGQSLVVPEGEDSLGQQSLEPPEFHSDLHLGVFQRSVGLDRATMILHHVFTSSQYCFDEKYYLMYLYIYSKLLHSARVIDTMQCICDRTLY